MGAVKDWSYTLKLVSCLWPIVGPWRVFSWGLLTGYDVSRL